MTETFELHAAAIVDFGEESDGARRVRVRAIPYGVEVTRAGRRLTFAEGSIRAEGPKPVTIDHGEGVFDRVGMVETFDNIDGAGYSDLVLADTTAARDVYELVKAGAITDVSVGVTLDTPTPKPVDGVTNLTGALDHIAFVGKGAFSNSDDGAKVLSVHNEGSSSVEDLETIDGAEDTPTVETYDDSELRSELVEMSERIDLLNIEAKDRPKDPDHELGVILRAHILANHAGGNRNPAQAEEARQFLAALADDTTTTSAGVVPNYYTGQLETIIDTRRQLISALTRDPIGDSGMNLEYPKVVSKVEVEAQATQKTEVGTAALDIDLVTVPLATYAGANDVAIQLIERSTPSFLTILAREFADQYARVTDAAACAAALAAVPAAHKTVVADLSADAAVTHAAFIAARTAIVADRRVPPRFAYASPDRFGELLSLLDTTKRPLFPALADGPRNALGIGSIVTQALDVHGLPVIEEPNAAADSVVFVEGDSMTYAEQPARELRALQVDLLGWNVGVYGYLALAVKDANGLYSIPAA